MRPGRAGRRTARGRLAPVESDRASGNRRLMMSAAPVRRPLCPPQRALPCARASARNGNCEPPSVGGPSTSQLSYHPALLEPEGRRPCPRTASESIGRACGGWRRLSGRRTGPGSRYLAGTPPGKKTVLGGMRSADGRAQKIGRDRVCLIAWQPTTMIGRSPHCHSTVSKESLGLQKIGGCCESVGLVPKPRRFGQRWRGR